jgi:hypothetical protein
MVRARPVFCAPPLGPTENTSVSPAFNIRVVLYGTSCPRAVTLPLKCVAPLCKTATYGADTILVPSESGSDGVRAGRWSRENKVRVLASDSSHQSEVIGKEIDLELRI